jgi:hypothetical protein
VQVTLQALGRGRSGAQRQRQRQRLRRQPAGGGAVILTPAGRPAGLLRAAGLPDTDTCLHPLGLRRSSPCSAALGIADVMIGSVMWHFGVPVMNITIVPRDVIGLEAFSSAGVF